MWQFCVIILRHNFCNNLAAFSCVIISGIPPFLLLSSPFHSLSIPLSLSLYLSLYHIDTHIRSNARKCILSLFLSYWVSLSIYLLLYFALFIRSPFGIFYEELCSKQHEFSMKNKGVITKTRFQKISKVNFEGALLQKRIFFRIFNIAFRVLGIKTYHMSDPMYFQ